MSYFQVKSYRYDDNPIDLGCIGVGFRFSILPDGYKLEAFTAKVIFAQQLLNEMGKQFIGGRPFIKPLEKSMFLRYAFNKLRQQLEQSNLINKEDIIIEHAEAAGGGIELLKQCEFCRPQGGKFYCTADKNNRTETSPQLCETCNFPEPIFRCDDLRIESIKRIVNASGDYRFQPGYYCLNGKTLPPEFKSCESLSCFTPYKFNVALP